MIIRRSSISILNALILLCTASSIHSAQPPQSPSSPAYEVGMALLKAGAGAIVARACYDLYDRAMHDPKEKKEKEEAERKEKEQHRELQERSLCIAESEAIQKGYILVLQVCNSGIPKEKCDELRNKHLTLLVLNTENKIRKEELQNNRLNSLEQTIQQPAQSLKEATQPKFLSAVSAAAKSVN